MSVDRMARVNELLKREISEALFQMLKRSDCDVSAVTVTHVVSSRNLRSARVLVSIRDNDEMKRTMLSTIRKKRPEIQSRINKDLVLKYTPKLRFELDESVEKGDRILHILSELEDHPPPEV